MTMKEAAKLAKKAQVKEMWLTHFSPSLVHPEEYMDGVREIFPNSYVGKDGKSVDLLFEELERDEPNHFAVRQYKKYKLAAGKTAKSILISCGARLAPFDIVQSAF